uniref:Uncharacterized protein n=1 Tax=Anguilla anguilla TaxID=7936 RepID=A0A0E9SH37_ANGAN
MAQPQGNPLVQGCSILITHRKQKINIHAKITK